MQDEVTTEVEDESLMQGVKDEGYRDGFERCAIYNPYTVGTLAWTIYQRAYYNGWHDNVEG